MFASPVISSMYIIFVIAYKLCIRALRGHKQTDPERPDEEGITFAQEIINSAAEKDFSVEFYLTKLHLLRQRFTTFKRILEDPSFIWNAKSNRVIVPKETWSALFQENPFAKAYRFRGEPEWKMLRNIFSDEDEDHWLRHAMASQPGSDIASVSTSEVVRAFIYSGERDCNDEPKLVDLVTTDEEDED
ncbi:UNVERIFIED_CONTAM: hypothetical protein Slati_4147700 [Sesamum latifolium]|uniref:Myb/SANT-like domain-containing protein n=1 Tax=Sesamum latifolium TaxID=2727402 RepID=A0AAW2TAR2_9LAMI